MKTIAICYPKMPLLWLLRINILLLLLLHIACAPNNDAGQTKLYAATEIENTNTVSASTGNTDDYAYSYNEESQEKPALYIVAKKTDVGRASKPGLPVAEEKKLVEKPFYLKEQPIQVFTIDNTRNQTIVGEKGIKVFFPKGSLKTDNPNLPVRVELVEYTTIADMLLADVTTTSNGKLIETGGTVEIRAYDVYGRELELKENMQINLAFPSAKPLPGMQCFYGNEGANGVIDWEASKSPFIVSAFTSTKPYDHKYIERRPDTLAAESFKAYAGVNYDNEDIEFLSFKALKAISDNFYINDNLIGLTNNYTFNVSFKIIKDTRYPDVSFSYQLVSPDTMKKSVFRSIRNERRIVRKELKNIIKNFVKKMPAADVDEFNDMNCTIKFNLHKTDSTILTRSIYKGSTKYFRGNKEVTRQQYKMPYEKFYEKMLNSDPEYYLINSGKLGWINCDRYPITNGAQKNIIVQLGEPAEKVKVKAVFMDVNSLADVYEKGDSPNTLFIKNVSEGLNIKFIVMKEENGQKLYATKTINTKEANRVGEFVFKPFTVNAIKQELASIE